MQQFVEKHLNDREFRFGPPLNALEFSLDGLVVDDEFVFFKGFSEAESGVWVSESGPGGRGGERRMVGQL